MAKKRKGGRKGGSRKVCACVPARVVNPKYKRCIVNALAHTRTATPKDIRKVFQKAQAKCRAQAAMPVVRRKARNGRRKAGKRYGGTRVRVPAAVSRAMTTGKFPKTVPPEIRRQLMGLRPGLGF